jgi:hypothetical protein
MTRRISRRHLLGRAGVAAFGTTGLGLLADAAQSDARVLYLLDPGTCGSGGCSACHACRLHAANSYFQSAEAADLHRAHPYCHCLIKAGPGVPDDTYLTLFGAPTASTRARVDLRMRWVQDALAQAHVPSPTAATHATTDAPSTPTGTSLPPADGVPSQAPPPPSRANPRHPNAHTRQTADLRVKHIAPRRLHLLIRIDQPAHVHAQLLTLRGQLLERRAFRAAAGRTAHAFQIPNGVPPGVYQLRLTLLADESGAQRRLERKVTITGGEKMPHTGREPGPTEMLAG